MSEREDRVLRSELDQLAGEFRREPLPAPTAEVDAGIRRAARAALQAIPAEAAPAAAAARAAPQRAAHRHTPRWLLPAGLAATVVLAFGVFLRVQEASLPRVPPTGEAETAAAGVAQDAELSATAAPASAAATADAAIESTTRAGDPADTADPAVPAEAAVAVMAAPLPAPPPAPMARSMAATPKVADSTPPVSEPLQQRAASEAAGPSAAVSNVIVSELEAPQASFERVLALYREGRTDEADAALAELERRYPDFLTPERRKLLPTPAPAPVTRPTP